MKKKIVLCTFATILSTTLIQGCGTPQSSAQDTEKEESVEKEIAENETDSDVHVLQLNGESATLDGTELEKFDDYTWHIDPSKEKEWHEGDEPETDAAAYIARDIMYYPELDEAGFTLQNYDGENEWVYHYTAEGLENFIFSTLPSLGDELPTQMMHSAEEAYENPVIHITKPGTYVIQGEWHGQIYVDLGDEDETFTDENAKVNVILNNANVTCDVAPAIIFDDLYECDNAWEDRSEYSNVVDTSNAGVTVTIAAGSENNFSGANIYRLLKPEYKKDSDSVQKKAHKIDGAFYSFVSMNIEGDEAGSGILNITSTTYEGLDDELHLTINGGNINIYSQDDAINVNEDGVSVFTMNDGTLHIFAGLGAEGDGVDSNGFITVNGGTIAGGTPSGSDSLLDSDMGNTINGGEVIVIGSKGFGGEIRLDDMGHGGQKPDGEMPFGDRPFGENPPEPPQGNEQK